MTMIDKKLFDLVDGVYTFQGENFDLRLSRVNRNRYGHIYGDVAVVTKAQDGKVAYLAQDSGNLSQGKFRSAVAAQAATRNSGNALAIDNMILDALIALQNDPELSPHAPMPSFKRLDLFMIDIPPRGHAVVEDLIEKGSVYGIASKPKVGKSILLSNLAVSVARGEDWLGRRTDQGRVYIFQLEDSEHTLERRFRRMTGGQWSRDIHLHIDPFVLSAENYDVTVDALKDAMLVILDPIIQASTVRDWHDATEVRDTYEYWRRLSRETDAAVVLAAHHRKMEGDHGDAMSGSIQAQATVDGIIELYRDKNLRQDERRLTFTGRDWNDMPDEVIGLDADTLTWTLNGDYSEVKEMAAAAKAQVAETQVLDALPFDGDGMSYEDIQAATGFGQAKVRNIIKNLGDKVRLGEGAAHGRGNKKRFVHSS